MATNLYGTALADLYSRGLDINPENPWALANAAFPQAQRNQPGITYEQILSQARNYLTPQPQPQPRSAPMPQGGPASGPIAAYDDLMNSMVGMTGPDTPMSPDTSIGGRLALDAQLSQPFGGIPGALGTLAGITAPFNPITAILAFAKYHNRDVIADAVASGGIGPVGGPSAGAQGGIPSLSSNDPNPGIAVTDPNVGITGIDPGQLGLSQSETGQGLSSGNNPAGGPGGPGPGPTGDAPADAGGGVSGVYKKGGVVSKRAPQHGSKFHPGFDRAKGTKITPATDSRPRPVKITAHEGEFVMNPAATKAARPALEALNALIPPEALDSLLQKGKAFWDARD